MDKLHNKQLRLKSVDENGKLITNDFENVFYNGKKKVYEVKTRKGYSIKTTDKHRFMMSDGVFRELKDISVGEFLYLNETDSDYTHLDEIISIEECGVEDVYDIEMKAPYHNYVANGFVVHNSQRYVRDNGALFIEPYWLADKSDAIKSIVKRDVEEAWLKYLSYLHIAPPQGARSILPNATKTEIVACGDAKGWNHLLSLRDSQAAHPDWARIIDDLKKHLAPILKS